jgi:hypothetical protein
MAPAPSLTLFESLLLYVIAPAAILLLIVAVVWLPGMVRSSRYRRVAVGRLRRCGSAARPTLRRRSSAPSSATW